MSETVTMRKLLLDELEHAVRTTRRLLDLVKPGDWDYRPNPNMRTLLEVAHHLVLVPKEDLGFLQEKSMDEVKAVEQTIQGERDAAKLGTLMEQGYAELQAYMTGLSEDDFLNKVTKACYAEHGMTQAKWLVEIVTHAFHHRSQLYSYLKQQGYDIQFFILY